MIASISSSLLAPVNRPYQYFFACPDISSETNKLITKCSAWCAWTQIHQALWQQCRKGSSAAKSAAEAGHLKCGMRRLAANAGCDVGTMRRQIRKLAQAGILRVVENAPSLIHDPITGRIITRAKKGSISRIEIVLTLGQEHMKPLVHSTPTTTTLKVHSAATLKVHSAATSKSLIEINTDRQTSEKSEGVRLSSVQEAPQIKYPPRISPNANPKARVTQCPNKRNNSYAEDFRAASWTDDCWLRTKQMLQQQQLQRELENREWEKERMAMKCLS